MIDKVSFLEKKEKIIVYVDGFNLYFGMKDAGLDNCKWLNIRKLIISILKPDQELIGIKYFTSRVGNNPDIQKIAAKELMPDFIQAGVFTSNHRDGLPLCNLLRTLDSENILNLIPALHPERKSKNTYWYFVNQTTAL